MKAKDIMEPITTLLSPDDTLREAVRKMKTAPRRRGSSGTRGLAVVDGRGRLAGILSQKDILRAALPRYLGAELADFSWDGLFKGRARAAGSILVGDVMTTAVVTVGEDDSVMECLEILLERNLQRIPVVDRSGRVVGMVLIRNIFELVTRLFAVATPEKRRT